ncbi:Oxysterol-binding protein-related protein 2 [Araneus ventricosus]|uniref:Oxysterol-binding protein n=1 Tax=Araneus ventricosus TaxID=182803 RepID=A0A4Y2ADE9_ARAVE|nr:Oxysterol-binding protein-related protein 2 [Araneus ventricosus]
MTTRPEFAEIVPIFGCLSQIVSVFTYKEDLDFRLVCEQVSHHPPVSAFHAESEDFQFYGNIHPRLKFWGKSLEIKPEGTLTVHLLKHKEVYSWTNVHCCVHNIIIGKLWFEQVSLSYLSSN